MSLARSDSGNILEKMVVERGVGVDHSGCGEKPFVAHPGGFTQLLG
jgi:hypothetical protein